MRQQNTDESRTEKFSISPDDIRVERDVLQRQEPGPIKNNWPAVDGPKPKCDGND